jgi:hypothetical protein
MHFQRRSLFAAAVGAACLALVPAASAVAPLAYVTPAAIAAKIRGFTPQIKTDNTSNPSTITATTCKGLPPARLKKFNTFRCSATWDMGRATVWARALPGGKFCASSTGLASCPAEPAVAGDPRICANAPAPSTADPNRCALSATQRAIIRAMPVNFNDPGWTIRNVSCTGSNLARTCEFSRDKTYGVYYNSTIGFKQVDGAWVATIVTTGDGGTSTCTVQPGPPAGGSRWAAGPVPTCTRG